MKPTLSPRLYLASASPRRAELLRQLEVGFSVIPAGVDEQSWPGEGAVEHVTRLALAKATTASGVHDDLPVLGADTVIELDGELLGKPVDRKAGLELLARLSDRDHWVHSGVAVAFNGQQRTAVNSSRVWFCAISALQREAYWATQEPRDKAGAYAIQGQGAMFIRHLEGSYSGVMGLPLFETVSLLQVFGIHPLAAVTDTGLLQEARG